MYKQLSSAIFVPFDVGFGPYEKEIAELAQEIRDIVFLVSCQVGRKEAELQAEERQEARSHRKFLSKYGDKTQKEHENARQWRFQFDRWRREKDREAILDRLSTYDHKKSYKQLRKQCMPGTSTWISENSDFQKWLSGSLDSLWCIGKRK